VLELLPLEKDLVAQKESAISTVTFFRGNYEKAAPILRERALEILRANPWLAGSVGKNTLSFPSAEPEKLPQGSFEVCDGEGGRRAVRLHRHTPFGEICKAVSPLFVQAGKCKLVWRVSIVPDSKDPSARFALITSLSHGAGDGNTYYQIHNMLWGSGSGKVQSLNPVRNFEVHQQTPTTKVRNQVFSPSFMLKTAWCIIYGKFFAREKCIVDISILNETWVKEQKAGKLHTPGVSFISTNDAVTSWLFNSGDNDLGVMAINLRGRIEGCRFTDAGNYEDMLCYMPPDFKSPSLIRKSINTLERASEPKTELPGTLAKLRSHCGFITNWSTFVEASHIPGCEEDLHLPLYDLVSTMPYNWTLCIIFRQRPGKLGLFIAGQPSKVKLLRSSLGPMGDAIDIEH